MNAGYVRLSRDDDRRSCVSIENQKRIIRQFAAEQNAVIDRWYEDDGVSGYQFDRPGFNQLMQDLDSIDTLYVKDFSRLGRHNAKVLLLLDSFKELGRHLVVIDDQYDSRRPEDDTIGIKTWFNEKYVKDTSRKIKRAIAAQQKEGTFPTQPPFGYRQSKTDKTLFEIVPREAEYIRLACRLYLEGFGCRRIAEFLTDQGAPTPSMARRQRRLQKGCIPNDETVYAWSEHMVRDLLNNDFYTGTLRLHKRERAVVHGKDRRVPKEAQYVFENHHPAVIDKDSFARMQNIKACRAKNRSCKNHRPGSSSDISDPFSGFLFCRGCGSRLTPIRRQAGGRQRKYYICSTYNTKGRRYCEKSHLIEAQDLMQDAVSYLRLCRNLFSSEIAAYDFTSQNAPETPSEEDDRNTAFGIRHLENQLTILLSQRISDLSSTETEKELIAKSYDRLRDDILAKIHKLKLQSDESKKACPQTPPEKIPIQNPCRILDRILEAGVLSRRDIESLIERIDVDRNGFPDIKFKYNIFKCSILKYYNSKSAASSPAQEMNRHENDIICRMMKLIMEDSRGYTSARYLSAGLTGAGFPKSKNTVLPYIGLMQELGILEKSGDPRKPYSILMPADKIQNLIQKYNPPLHYPRAGRRHAADGI